MKIHGYFYFAILTLLMFILSGELKSQVAVTQGTNIAMTPQEFVETYLVGTGIIISNATYNGSVEPLNSPNRLPLKYRDQIGTFINTGGAQTQLGIDGGVILSTGYTAYAAAPNDPDDNMQGNNQPAESDPDLVILAGGSQINDKSVLEFDFIPQTNVVTFRYVFGSKEFDQYCNSINDAFGLFLSGPGLTGGLGFANDAVNIALLPNSANYVNIFNICDEDQGNLGDGVYSWWNDKKDYFSFNRLTHVFTASYTIECDQTYHMKFAIGDASDGILDSGVFLEQNSFTSNNITTAASFSNPLTGQMLVENCSNVSLIYTVPQAPSTDLTIQLAIMPSGTATQADILPNPFPAQVVIPAGQLQSPPILIVPVSDGIPEAAENLVIKGTTLVCSLTTAAETEFQMTDFHPMSISMNDVTLCDGSSATLAVNITGGQPVMPDNIFLYQWSTGATTETIVVSPPSGHNLYSVTVTDACGQSALKQVSVDVGTTPAAAGPVSGVNTICTPLFGATYSVPAITGADAYLWTLPPGATITGGLNTNSITVDFDATVASGTISVLGHSTYCGDGASSSMPLVINPSVPAAGPITGIGTICQGTSAVDYSIAPLSYTSSYEWTVPAGVTIQSGGNTNHILCSFTNNAVSGNISVRGYNSDCLFGPASVKPVVVNPLPGDAGIIGSIAGAVVCVPEQGIQYSITPIANASTYAWNYTGNGITQYNNGSMLLIDFSAAATPGNLMVKGQNGCGDGVASPPFPVAVNLKPTVDFSVCNSLKTTKNGRPVILKGGSPLGPGGVYSGPGVSAMPGGSYVFDPASSSVIGGTTTNAVDHPVTFRYTNAQGCYNEQTIQVSVFASNATSPCPGTIKDCRDNKNYPTFLAGTGANARCWMAANLNYGSFSDNFVPQTDNCIIEKYCKDNLADQCDASGGYYQWGEIMEHQASTGFQDICPPGWHVPTSAEWQTLVDSNQGDGIAGGILQSEEFNAAPGGIFYLNNIWSFTTSGNLAASMYWTSTLSGSKSVARGVNNIDQSVSFYESSRANALQVRCIKD